MGSKQKKEGGAGLSRRDFLKVSAAGAAGVAAANWAVVEPALAAPLVEGTDYDTFHTTCPYCSAQCGQIVAVSKGTTLAGKPAGDILDIWGDKESPINQGGLCAKGAGSHQLATNLRRLGYPHDATAPLKWQQPKAVLRYDAGYAASGLAWKRVGNQAWQKMDLQTAMNEAAALLVAKRGGTPVPGMGASSNVKGVQFFGSSHMNNEPNYMYRKVIANFGTSLVEHQARI